uniref:tRNA-splicing endonuclease subunit Sen2 n=1 Tax=Myxine glutinosa TaxID=7769 RepID=UPI00358F361F
MTSAVFQPPRRKRNVEATYEGPFPAAVYRGSSELKRQISGDVKVEAIQRTEATASLLEEAQIMEEEFVPRQRCFYSAELIHGSVVVNNHRDASEIYFGGCFGKGVLSRSKPSFTGSHPGLLESWEEKNPDGLPVISEYQFSCHLNWYHSTLLLRGQDEQTTASLLHSFNHPGSAHLSVTDGDQLSAESIPALHTEEIALARTTCSGQKGSDVSELCDDSEPTGEQHGLRDVNKDLGRSKFVLVPSQDQNSGEGHEAQLFQHREPYLLIETLQLAPEEAFFLSYALGCLVISQKQKVLTQSELWCFFIASCPNFAAVYAAYHHFRSCGWVPKPGLKYGTDFLLYRKGPAFYHASYSVIVEMVRGGGYCGQARRPFSWRSLSALNRTTASVSKELLFCFVVCPQDLTSEQLKSPECLKKLKVQEVLVNRWVSSRECVEKQEMDI